MDELFEFASETTEAVEGAAFDELNELMSAYQAEIDEARESGNLERESHYKAKLESLKEQLTVSESSQSEEEVKPFKGQELSFGNSREGFSDGHSESYWAKKAGEELAKNGKTSSYHLYMKRLAEAKADRIMRRSS